MATSLAHYQGAVAKAIADARECDLTRRIWRKDAAIWKVEEAHQKIIRNSLGWLTVPGKMAAVADEVTAFADEIRGTGTFKHVMVCGMGGSSLCPEVLRQTFGIQQGYPELLVLDSTDPDVLADFGRQIDIERCLFVIASKSGTTTEPLVFYKYWYDQVRRQQTKPGDSFIAITDPGTRMVEMATADQFRHIFLNPPDIGGRYSALSYFGLVPAALMGLDLKRLLERAEEMVRSCGAEVPPAENPGVCLGAIMGECAKAGRNKLTIVTDRKVAALGLWVEQLVAESTGKEGQGILPVQGEPLGAPTAYGADRLFVSIGSEQTDEQAKQLEALAKTGHPVVRRTLTDNYDLASEFFVWEFATAVAGWRLGINPFDQPNVQESKDATRELLDFYKSHGKLEDQEPVSGDDTLTVYSSERTGPGLSTRSVLDALRAHLATVKSGDYIALLVYVEETPDIEATLQTIRMRLRDSLHCATTIGYGPRFLHSTGQLHKGGPDSGVFIQITAADHVDLPIPDEPYTFSVLKQAQALGDFRSLVAHGRRAIRIDLGTDALSGLQRLQKLLADAMETSVESSHG
ncbi:MAG TPA: bifunctional transaldolase/phosoglucose isomerase [Pyrinomonadaceae bacterium]|nr:bifunctional transaldolase/phosoglucose isomerase [Pyrinomonadaceae bacterium]